MSADRIVHTYGQAPATASGVVLMPCDRSAEDADARFCRGGGVVRFGGGLGGKTAAIEAVIDRAFELAHSRGETLTVLRTSEPKSPPF